MKRSYDKFVDRLKEAGLLNDITERAKKWRVSLRDLYEGPSMPSIVVARREVYMWLSQSGKSANEIARLFDRNRAGVWRTVNYRSTG